MRYKKIAVVITAATLLLSTMTMAFAETPFTDIEKNWAKAHIISVYEKGLMKGTAAGQFSPDAPVNKYSAIVTIGRMLGSQNSDMDALLSKHKAVLDKYKVPDYARNDTAFCLEKGIIQSEFEMDKFETQIQATKLDICVYLARAFGVQIDTTKPPVVLSFKDALSIPSMYKIYVDYMIKIGVVDGKGDAEGLFKPDMAVTRAMFAKMLDYASNEYAKTNPPAQSNTEEKPAQEDSSTTIVNVDSDSQTMITDKGIIDTITYSRNSQPKILLENESKKLVEYTIPADIIKENIIINGKLADIYSIRPGLYVEVKVLSGKIERLATIDTTERIHLKGDIKRVDLSAAVMYVNIYNDMDKTVTEKKIYLKDAKIVDLLLNNVSMDLLYPGQKVDLAGIENAEGIIAQTVILNQ